MSQRKKMLIPLLRYIHNDCSKKRIQVPSPPPPIPLIELKRGWSSIRLDLPTWSIFVEE